MKKQLGERADGNLAAYWSIIHLSSWPLRESAAEEAPSSSQAGSCCPWKPGRVMAPVSGSFLLKLTVISCQWSASASA